MGLNSGESGWFSDSDFGGLSDSYDTLEGDGYATEFTPYESPLSGNWQFNSDADIGFGSNFDNYNQTLFDNFQSLSTSGNNIGLNIPNMGLQEGLGGGEALTSSGWDTSGVKNVLSNLFSNPKTWNTLLGGVLEDRSRRNARQTADPRKMIQWLQQNTPQDPTKPMRDNAQNSFIQANQDPNSVAIVRDQLNAIQAAQDRKDAAAGRRSNVVGSAPAVLGAQGKVINDYLNNMAQFRIQPNAGGLGSLYGQGQPQLLELLKGGDIGGLMTALQKLFQENPSLANLSQLSTNPLG